MTVPNVARDAFYVDGVDLYQAVTCVQSVDGIYTTPNARGENVVIPGRHGEIWVPKSVEANTVTLGIILNTNSQAAFNSAYRQLRRLMPPGKKLQLTRQTIFLSGTETHVATGEYAGGLEPEVQFLRFGKLAVSLRVHDGLWYSQGPVSVTGAAPVVAGDAETRRMAITMAAGTLTNSTTGHAVTYSGTGTATIYNEEMRAIAAGVDVSNQVRWTKHYPMTLAPGTNTMDTTVVYDISYYPAYL